MAEALGPKVIGAFGAWGKRPLTWLGKNGREGLYLKSPVIFFPREEES